jgi:hypothetical protein
MNTSLQNVPKFTCESCDYICSKQSVLNKHLSTDKHKKNMNVAKNVPEYVCSSCDYKCGKEYMLNRHMSTRKHIDRCATSREISTRECNNCKKVYSNYKSYWAHSRKCSDNVPNVPGFTELINRLLTENQELRTFVMNQSNTVLEQTNEVMKKIMTIQPTTIINNSSGNTNSNNKFNVNVFLDTECKDAMNFEDFVNGIEVSQDDIQNNGRLGFVEGISKIIMDNLNRLSVHQRPIHCTDWKREVLYIKDDNKWTKEIDAKKIRDAIQVVSQKSIRTLHAWKMSNPDYKRGSSVFSMECIGMQLHSVAGEHREVYYPKVAKLVAKHVLVDKKNC